MPCNSRYIYIYFGVLSVVSSDDAFGGVEAVTNESSVCPFNGLGANDLVVKLPVSAQLSVSVQLPVPAPVTTVSAT